MQRLSSRSITCWRPRRKCYSPAHGVSRRCTTPDGGRQFNTQASEASTYDASQDIPFWDGFPERLIREGLPRRLKRNNTRKELAIEDIWRPIERGSIASDPLHEASEKHQSDSVEDTSNSRLSAGGPKNPCSGQDATVLNSSKEIIEDHRGRMTEFLDEREQFSGPSSKISEDPAAALLEEGSLQRDTSITSTAAVHCPAQQGKSSPIHILGSGRLGKFIAHSVAGLPHAPPVTLLLHTSTLMKRWDQEGCAIKILRNGKLAVQSQIRVEFSGDAEAQKRGFQRYDPKEQESSVIQNLIVTTDGFATIPALTAIKHRLRPWSTVCFLQEGMGIIEKVNEKLFPGPETRPNFAVGHVSHKLTPTEKAFTVIEEGKGEGSLSVLIRTTKARRRILIGHAGQPLIRRLDGTWGPFYYLIRTLSRSPELKMATLGRPDFHVNQLEKLAVNAVVGPLSVLFDCPNEQLLNNNDVVQTMRLILRETSLILRSLPEISRVSKIDGRFSPERLEYIVVSTISKTGGNSSAMLQRFKAGRRTGVEFYNGYLINRAVELGIACPHNEMLLTMVKAKQTVRSRRDESYIPFRGDR